MSATPKGTILIRLYDPTERDMKTAEPFERIEDAFACYERWRIQFPVTSERIRLVGSPGEYEATIQGVAAIAETAPAAIAGVLLYYLTTEEEFERLRPDEIAYKRIGRTI